MRSLPPMPAHCTEPGKKDGSATVVELKPPGLMATDLPSFPRNSALTWKPLNTGDWYTSACEARRQNGWPTPPAASTASQTMPAAGTPGAMKPPEDWLLMQFGFGAWPVVSRRPMIAVTGPQKPTVPTLHSE